MRKAVRVATAGDAGLVGSICASGFADDPVMTWVFTEPGRAAKLDAVWGFLAREALVPLGHTYLLGDATAAWTPPDAPAWPPNRIERFQCLLDQVCEPNDTARLRRLDDLLAANHPDEPVWYLGSVAAAPSAQGRGLGSRLLAETLAVIDRTGLPAYLEATSRRSAPLYARHGFRRIADLTLPGGPTLVAMRRDPAGGRSAGSPPA